MLPDFMMVTPDDVAKNIMENYAGRLNSADWRGILPKGARIEVTAHKADADEWFIWIHFAERPQLANTLHFVDAKGRPRSISIDDAPVADFNDLMDTFREFRVEIVKEHVEKKRDDFFNEPEPHAAAAVVEAKVDVLEDPNVENVETLED